MGIIAGLIGKSTEELEKEGTYVVIEEHERPSLRKVQIGGDYVRVAALHIKGMGGAKGLGRSSCGTGRLGHRVIHGWVNGWLNGKTLCDKNFKNVVPEHFTIELTCPECLNKVSKQSLRNPGVVEVSMYESLSTEI
jgi:hypothetical protein